MEQVATELDSDKHDDNYLAEAVQMLLKRQGDLVAENKLLQEATRRQVEQLQAEVIVFRQMAEESKRVHQQLVKQTEDIYNGNMENLGVLDKSINSLNRNNVTVVERFSNNTVALYAVSITMTLFLILVAIVVVAVVKR